MNVNILIISNNDDFATDMVCVYLKTHNVPYLRVNRRDFASYNVNWDISAMKLQIEIEENLFVITSDSLKAVYYRAPTFLRESYYKYCSYEEQLEASQWMAFIRNLMVFNDAYWMNNPQDIYKAENKLYQLTIAQIIGLSTPKTLVQNNHLELKDNNTYAVKSIDTAIFGDNHHSFFAYTTILSGAELKKYNLKIAPVCIQECIAPKIDIRVTYIEGQIFASAITNNNKPIYGDWRLQKDKLTYSPYELPISICEKLSLLMKSLNLSYGGIDLMFSGKEYFFVEVNPTGEWAWLIEPCNYNFPKIIGDVLLEKTKEKYEK